MPLLYSATSVFLPHLNLTDTCRLLQTHGYDGIELRVRYFTGDAKAAPSPWGRHLTDLSPDNILARANEVRDTLAAHKLELAAFASACRANELPVIEKLAAGAAALGCPRVRVSAPRGYDAKVGYQALYDEAARAYERALNVTRRHGVKILVELHGGTIFVSASLAHRLLRHFDPREIGVIYDPQNMVMDGFETVPLALDLLGPYVAHVHVGGRRPVAGAVDANGTVKWGFASCRIGEGLFNTALLIAELRRRQYAGFVCVEDFDDQRPPETRVADAIRYLRGVDLQ